MVKPTDSKKFTWLRRNKLTQHSGRRYGYGCIALLTVGLIVYLTIRRHDSNIDRACWSPSVYNYEDEFCKSAKSLATLSGWSQWIAAADMAIGLTGLIMLVASAIFYLVAGKRLGLWGYQINESNLDDFKFVVGCFGGLALFGLVVVGLGSMIYG